MRIGKKKIKKSSPKITNYFILEYEDTRVRFYNSGMITFSGYNIKHAAIAVARYFLDDVIPLSGLFHYPCIDVYLEKDKKFTVEWVGGGVLLDDACPEPKFWEEFKREFERYCELKVFL